MRDELQKRCLLKFGPLLEIVSPGWIAGGAVRDFFSQQVTDSDVDVFFPDELSWTAACERMKSHENAKLLYENPAMICFRFHGMEVQLLKNHFFATPQETIAQFDFTVCCCACSATEVVVHEHFFEDLAGRRLAINKMPFPMSTLERLQKYVRKGFIACNGTLLSIAKAIQETNLSDPEKNTLSFYPDGSPRFARFD